MDRLHCSELNKGGKGLYSQRQENGNMGGLVYKDPQGGDMYTLVNLHMHAETARQLLQKWCFILYTVL